MPKRARSRSTTRTTKRPKFAAARARRARVRRSRISVTGNIHSFSRWGVPFPYNPVTQQGSLNYTSDWSYDGLGTLTTNAGTSTIKELPLTTQFTLTDISNSSEFSALYDQYKICGVKVSIKMISCPDATYTAGGTALNQYSNFYPTLWYVRDYDDTALVTTGDIRQYKSVKHVTLRPNKELSIFVKPRVLKQVFNSTTGAGYEIALPKFIDMANNALPHFGLKMVFDFEGQNLPITSVLSQFKFRLNYKYYFMCKDVR